MIEGKKGETEKMFVFSIHNYLNRKSQCIFKQLSELRLKDTKIIIA